MGELALYRKYRSREFSKVLGQPHVVKTLTAALASGRISHAYLFTGPRGVGKTTVARLLARSLNCTGTSQSKPCNTCANCSVEIGSHLDLIEIDAASNRRIDEIRDLREKIGLAPAMGRYKVYIIDEVHMLTTEAFNALLKTLEEPPSHAVFILATTEAQKLPATVVSRTQRFNFRPISVADLSSHLATIAKLEKITISTEALALLAEAAKGSFRDAISLLDQVAGLGAAKIDATAIQLLLGWSDQQSIKELSDAINAGQTASAIKVLDRLKDQGVQVNPLIEQLCLHFRGLLRESLGTEEGLSELDPQRLASIIERLTTVAKSHWPELSLEASIIQLTHPELTHPELTRPQAKSPRAAAVPAKLIRSTAPSDRQPRSEDLDLWNKALLIIKNQNNSLYALLKICRVDIENSNVTVSCRFNFHRQRLEEAKNRRIIELALEKTYRHKLTVSCRLDTAETAPVSTDSTSELVSSALEILGGELIDE